MQPLSSIGGFGLQPAPNRLNAIVRLDLLQSEPTEKIQEIWSKFYADKELNIAQVWSRSDFNKMMAVARKDGRLFIFPVAREGGHFIVLSQVQEKLALFTYLEDYKKDPQNAQPYMAVTFYDELAASNDVVLARGDLNPGALNTVEATRLLDLLRSFYVDQSGDIESFNKGTFDFEGHIKRLS